MEKMLQKLATQLDSLDEASLMALWSKYATLTSRFEPTKRWEEACLIFSLIQAKHFKNQLFNYCWQKERMPRASSGQMMPPDNVMVDFDLLKAENASPPENGCRVLRFSPAGDEEEKD